MHLEISTTRRNHKCHPVILHSNRITSCNKSTLSVVLVIGGTTHIVQLVKHRDWPELHCEWLSVVMLLHYDSAKSVV